MIEKIREILSACGVSVYRITETKSSTAELYFIKKKLDIPRKKELTEYTVVVFRDMEKDGQRLRAATNVILSPGMTDEEITARIKDAYYAANFAGNPWFDLPKAEQCSFAPSDSDLAALEPEEAADRLAKGIFEIDTETDAFLNSVEIFVTKKVKHIVASNGLDVSFEKCEAEGEIVAQCVTPKDVEQFRSFSFSSLDIAGLQKRALDAIRDVRARANSTEPPKGGKYDVILTGEHLNELLYYYCARSSAQMIYPGYSQWQCGTAVQGDDVKGEKLDLSFVPTEPYSDEGIRMTKRELIRQGELKLIHGPARFCYYLGAEPTGTYRKLISENGTVPYAKLCGEGVLEPISFSDFQMDEMDGHFKGEIRLALLHHADGSTTLLSGGSVNGSLPEAQKNLLFSLERYEDSSYAGPLAVKIPDVSVAGL